MSEPTPTTAATHQAVTNRRQATKKPIGLRDIQPVADIGSYDDVPWFRRSWFALGPLLAQSLILIALTVADVTRWFVQFPLFAPVLFVIVLTGDVYVKANFKKMKEYSDAEVWRYTSGGRVAFAVVSLIMVAFFIVTAVGG